MSKVTPPDFGYSTYLPNKFIGKGDYYSKDFKEYPFFRIGGRVKELSILWLRLEIALKLYGYVELDGKMLLLHRDGITIGEIKENSDWGGNSLQDYEYFIYKNEFIIRPKISDVCKIYKILSNYEVPKDVETLALIKLG